MKPSINNERGVAMILAIFAMIISIVVATEVAYETYVEYVSSTHAINRIKAHYAAKSGVELSLYRILLYKKVLAQFGEQLKDNRSLLDPIWQFPFSWPPLGLEEMNESDQDSIRQIIKESSMDAQYMAIIESEGGKIDINDLGSPIKALQDSVRAQLLQIFENELEYNKSFKEKYENFKFEQLVNNIQDYVDEDSKSLTTNGDESVPYKLPDDVKNYRMPPNAPFKTLDELHMVHEMEDEFFNLLKDKITVYGTKGININYASEQVIKSLDPQFKDEVLAAIINRRSDPKTGGPFKDSEDFYSFVEGENVNTQAMRKAKLETILLFDEERNFRIISSGQYANVRREITAITFDIDGLTDSYAKLITDSKKEDNPNEPANEEKEKEKEKTDSNNKDPNSKTPENKANIPQGKPTVVFWHER